VTIEAKSIDVVTVAERHGRARDLLYFWFLGNFHFLTIAIGFVGPSLGLSLGFTAAAGILGTLFGTVFVACHAAQGPELGLPQMIQSRAQLGFRGVSVVLIGSLLTFLGFNVANAALMAHGLHELLGWNEVLVVLATSAAGAALAICGHDWLHRVFRWCLLLCLPLYGALSISIFKGFVPIHDPIGGGFSWTAFLAQLAASASYSISYAPAVSDYSRYLPRATSRGMTVAAAYLGSVTSAIWLIIVGAWLATRLHASDSLVALHAAGDALLGGFGTLLVLSSVLALTAVTGLNAYSGMLSVITGLNSLLEMPASPRLRVLSVLALTVIWATLALSLTGGGVALVGSVLTLTLYLLAPWTSINLIDYFLVRRGRYAVMELFAPDGIYGSWNLRGLTAYAAGLAASVPFAVSSGVYVGPLAARLGRLDLGWLAGLVVAGIVYLVLSRSYDAAREESAAGESARLLAALEADQVSSVR
jgi:purine-cytosine permease-like protein